MYRYIILLFLLMACRTHNDRHGQYYQYYDRINYAKFNGKKISYIQSGKMHINGHDIIIYFTDGTKLNIWCYKYPMRIYQ